MTIPFFAKVVRLFRWCFYPAQCYPCLPLGAFPSQVRMEERATGLSSSLEGELLSTF